MNIQTLWAGLLLGSGMLASQAAPATPLQDLVDGQAAGTWLMVNQNKFQDVWAPSGQKPSGPPVSKIGGWNGGGFDPVTGDFYVLGADEPSYFGNEVYRWNGNTLRWQRDSLPSSYAFVGNNPKGIPVTQTVDGPVASPMAAETYDTIVFLPTVRRVALMGGTPVGFGGFVEADLVTPAGPYFFDPSKADPNKVGGKPGSQINAATYPNVQAGEMWENRQSNKNYSGIVSGIVKSGISLGQGVTAVTQIDGKDVVYAGEDSVGKRLFKYTVNSLLPGDETWELVGVCPAQTYNGAGAGAYDSLRPAFMRTSQTPVLTYNPTANTMSSVAKFSLMYWNLKTAGPSNTTVYLTRLLGDDLPLTSHHGIEYDPSLDAYVLWDGAKDVWLVYPPNQLGSEGWFVRKHTPAGNGPARGYPFNGIYGKWNHMPGIGGLMGVSNATTGDVWVYKPDPAMANPKPPVTYAPSFRPTASGGMELLLVDPSNPGTPILVEPNLPVGTDNKAILVSHGVAMGPRTATALHNRSLVYANGNSLYKVDLRQSANQVPVQLSSESHADQICGFAAVAADYQNHDNSSVVYSLSGPDGNCLTTSDNVYRMVRMGMDQYQPPLEAKQPLTALYDNQHTPVGWLAIDGATITRADGDFTNPTVLTSFSGTAANAQFLGMDTANQVGLLKVDAKLLAYHKTTGLSAVLHTFADASRTVLYSQDDYHTYFVDRGASSSTIRRIRSDASLAPALVVTETQPILSAPKPFRNYLNLAYLVGNTTNSANVRMVAKMGGTPATLSTGVSPDFLEVSSGTAYYNVPVGTTGFKAGRYVMGAGNVQLTNSRWVGSLMPTSSDTGAAHPVRLLRVDRLASDRDAGGALVVIDPTTNLVLDGLGNLPMDISRFSLAKSIGTAYAGSGVATGSSINGPLLPTSFYFDSEKTASLATLGIGNPVVGGNLPPVVNLLVDPTSGQGNTASLFRFDASASIDPDGSISSYAWNFGDGSSASGATVSHTFGTSGSYSVRVTVTDDKGAQSTGTVAVTVDQLVPPTISIGSVHVVGTVSDLTVSQITVNGQAVQVNNGSFDALIPVGTGTTGISIQASGLGGSSTKTMSVTIP